ncbi:MAG: hypothetical protein U1A27_10505 [Phycisphaerae bacterium]
MRIAGPTSAGAASPDDFLKGAGVPCVVSARLRAAPVQGPQAERTWDVSQLDAELAGVRVRSIESAITLGAPVRADGLRALLARDWDFFADPHAAWRARLALDVAVREPWRWAEVFPGLRQIRPAAKIDGSLTGQLLADAAPAAAHVAWRVDATQAALAWHDALRKPAGVAGLMECEADLRREAPAPDAAVWTIRVGRWLARWGSAELVASGEARLRPTRPRDWMTLPRPQERIESATAQIVLRAPTIADGVGRLTWPIDDGGTALALESGGVAGTLRLAFADGRLVLRPSELKLDALAGRLSRAGAAEPLAIAVSGPISLTDDHVRVSDVAVRAGESRLRISANLDHLSTGPRGSALLSADRLDLPELRGWLAASDGGAVAGPRRAALLDALRRADLQLTLHGRSVRFGGIGGGPPIDADELSLSAAVAERAVHVQFGCAVDGGWVSGAWSAGLDDAAMYDLAYEARDLAPAPGTRPIVENFFPGMTVTGRMSMTDASHDRLWPPPGVPSYPTGSGEMRIRGGTIVGRAAPKWVASIFPGLNVASFEFSEMVNRFEKHADGSHHNVMTFFGRYYHLYVDGETQPDGRARYEVGVDLFARFAPDLARIGQGRVALFIKTGRVKNGVMEDEVVSYLTPVQVMQKIWTNNLLTTAYHAIRQQVSG